MAATPTFLSGFSEGFINERNRRLDKETDQENLMFKYKMDNLMNMREKRSAQKAKETEWTTQAQDLAAQVGDNDFATVAYKELRNGVSYETLQKRAQEGAYEKNPNYTKPTQTIRVPSAVSAPTPTTTGIAPYEDPLVTTDFAGNKVEQNVNKKIDQLDPTLRADALGDDDDNSVATEGSADTPYVYKPKNKIEIGDYKDALYKEYKAKQDNDPAALREAQAEIKIHQRVLSEKAKADALAQGKNVDTYVSINPDGTIGAQFSGERRDDGLYNISNPNGEQQVTGAVRAMSDDDIKRLNTLEDNFGKQSEEYKTNSGAFIAAMDSSQKLAHLVQADPGVTTYAYSGIQLLNNLEGEFQAGYGAIVGVENEINNKIASGDMQGVEKLVADHAKQVEDFVSKSVLTPENQKKAVNKAVYESLKIQTAYQFAISSGQGGKLSNQDFENNLAKIGGDKNNDPRIIVQNLRNTAQESFLKLKTAQNALNSDASIKSFEKRMGIKTGLSAERIGDQIMVMDLPPEQKQLLMQYLGSVGESYVAGKNQTEQSLQPAPEVAPPVEEQKVPQTKAWQEHIKDRPDDGYLWDYMTPEQRALFKD